LNTIRGELILGFHQFHKNAGRTVGRQQSGGNLIFTLDRKRKPHTGARVDENSDAQRNLGVRLKACDFLTDAVFIEYEVIGFQTLNILSLLIQNCHDDLSCRIGWLCLRYRRGCNDENEQEQAHDRDTDFGHVPG
jgi:hypothetical protein